MTARPESVINRYVGLSTDSKPTVAGGIKVLNGSMFFECDTEITWKYNGFNDTWYQLNTRVDASTHATTTIEYEHHEIHGGSHYFVNGSVTLTIDDVYDIRITTPSSTKQAHMLYHVTTDSETDIYMYEDVAITNAGTAIPSYNNYRASLNSSGLVFDGILNESTALANADTNLAGSVALTHRISGDGKDGGIVTRNDELILIPSTIYCKRFIASAAGYINWKFQWYEHTDKV